MVTWGGVSQEINCTISLGDNYSSHLLSRSTGKSDFVGSARLVEMTGLSL